jgi:hypothetical protein
MQGSNPLAFLWRAVCGLIPPTNPALDLKKKMNCGWGVDDIRPSRLKGRLLIVAGILDEDHSGRLGEEY